jgi:hypothetical protein
VNTIYIAMYYMNVLEMSFSLVGMCLIAACVIVSLCYLKKR